MLLLLSVLLYTGCSEITAPPDEAPPATPLNFTLLGGGDGQASFRWSRNTEPDFFLYRVFRSVGQTDTFSLLAETAQNEFLDQFLDYDSVYYYRLSAIDFAGNESLPTQIIDVRPINISSPTSPENVQVFGHNYPELNQVEFFVNWRAPNIGDLWKYFIYRGDSPDFIPSTENLIDSSTVGIYYDRQAVVGDRFYYRISAMDLGRKISVPSPPQNDIILQVIPLESPSNRIEFRPPYTLSWKRVENAVNYRVYVAKSPLTDIVWSSELLTDVSATYKGPQFEYGALYYWWVASYSKNPRVNDSGDIVEADINSRSEIWTFFIR